MKREFSYNYIGSHSTETADSSAAHQSDSDRKKTWERRMAELEAIHIEITPQLEALRALDDEPEMYDAWALDTSR